MRVKTNNFLVKVKESGDDNNAFLTAQILKFEELRKNVTFFPTLTYRREKKKSRKPEQ
jgi:hypothetical protein